jgi:hypothetical protein
MPRPIYIICSQGGSEDKASGQVSLFNVIDKLFLRRNQPNTPPPPPQPGISQIRITASWMRVSGDYDQEFEFETRMFFPPENAMYGVAKGTFTFAQDWQRLTNVLVGPLPIQGPGILRVQNRVRRKGSEEWVAQECPIIVEEVVPPPPPPEPEKQPVQ